MLDSPQTTASTAPLPLDTSEIPRVSHTRLRRRMLYSQHDADVQDRVTKAMGAIRASAQGLPDLSANVFLSVWSQVMVLYNQRPTQYPPDGSTPVTEAMDGCGYWPMMQRVSRDVGGLREMLVRFDVDASVEGGALRPRPVFPDMVECTASPSDPSIADGIIETIEDPIHGWVRHHLNIRNPAAPSYRVTKASNGEDITRAVLGATVTDAGWPSAFRRADDTPFLPYAWYHAAKTGFLFDPWAMREVVEGSLSIAVLLTFYHHLVKNASWPQRWMMGCVPAGLESVDVGSGQNGDPPVTPHGYVARSEVTTDPASVVILVPMPETLSQQVGQWSASSDPEAILRSIQSYIRHVYSMAGIQSPDVTRGEADVRSGYSLAVSRESIRDQQRVYETQFRRGDQAALSIAAAILNRIRGTTYAESPDAYAIHYEGLPLSPTEEAAKLAQLRAKVEGGQIGPVSAYVEMHPECPRDQAVVAVAMAAMERDEVDRTVRMLSGRDPDAAPVAPLSSQQLQYATTIVTAAAAATMPLPATRAMLIGLIGIPEAQADAIIAGLGTPTPAAPPSTPPVN